jgi:DNA-binding transcriptional regulator GbsR (MarR family)
VKPKRKVLDWVERVAMYLSADGVPPMAGRILGWLMICDRPEQTAAETCAAIGGSRASFTTNVRVLLTMGLVSRRTKPGERTGYYRVVDNAWERVVRRQIAGLSEFREVTRDGLALVGGASSQRAARIREAHEVFEWMAKVFDNAPPPSSTGRRGS